MGEPLGVTSLPEVGGDACPEPGVWRGLADPLPESPEVGLGHSRPLSTGDREAVGDRQGPGDVTGPELEWVPGGCPNS